MVAPKPKVKTFKKSKGKAQIRRFRTFQSDDEDSDIEILNVQGTIDDMVRGADEAAKGAEREAGNDDGQADNVGKMKAMLSQALEDFDDETFTAEELRPKLKKSSNAF